MDTTANYQNWMTVNQIANRAGVTPETVRRWFQQAKLPGDKLGRDWVARPIDVEIFLEQREREKPG